MPPEDAKPAEAATTPGPAQAVSTANAGPAARTGRQRATSTARRALRVTQYFSGGSFLPLVHDKTRNNVRSPVLLVATYMLAVLLVSVIVVLQFAVPADTGEVFSWNVRPAVNVHLGHPWPSFSLRFATKKNKGIANRLVYVSITPLQRSPMEVTVDKQRVRLGYLDCLEEILLPNARVQLNTMELCSPAGQARALVPSAATTDEYGIATFANVTLAHGFASEYVVVAGVLDAATGDASGFHVAKTIISVHTDDVALKILPDSPQLSVEPTIGEPLAVVANASWTAPAALRPPTFIMASILPIPLVSASAYNRPPFAPFELNGPEATAGLILNRVARVDAADIHVVGRAGTGATATVTYEATFHFNVTIYCSNTKQLYLGVFFFGQLIPLQPVQLSDESMSPSTIVLPFSIQTPVGKVFASLHDATFNATWTTSDGTVRAGDLVESRIATVRVTVFDVAGRPLAGRVAFARLAASRNFTSATFSSVVNTPSAVVDGPKGLIGQFSNQGVTDAQGTLEFTTRVSSSGPVGVYDLYVDADGITATWMVDARAATNATATGAAGYRRLSLNVRSSIATWQSSEVIVSFEKDLDREAVMLPWRVLPAVRVFAADGLPIPGKHGALLPDTTDPATRAADPVVVALTHPSDDLGWVRFATVYVTTCRGASTTSTVLLRFNLTVDGATRYRFARNVTVLQESLRYAPRGSCASVRPITLPDTVYTNRKTRYTLQAVDVYGDPVANASISQVVDQRSYPLGFAEMRTTDANGLLDFNSTLVGIHDPTAILTYFACASHFSNPETITISTWVVIYVVNRVQRVVSFGGNDTSLWMTLDADWDAVSAESPVVVQARVAWEPSYQKFLFPPDARTKLTSFAVTGPSTANATVSIVGGRTTPGTNLYVFYADDYPMLSGSTSDAPKVAAVTIEQDALDGLGTLVPTPGGGTIRHVSSLAFGDTFPHQPRVRLTKADGSPAGGEHAFAQLGSSATLVDANSASIAWHDVFANPTALAQAAVAGRNASGPTYQTSPPADANGRATLPQLFVVGADVSHFTYLRYCYTANLRIGGWTAGQNFSHITVCAVEAVVMTFAPSQQLLMSLTVDAGVEVAGVPGMFLPPITLRVSRVGAAPPSFFYVLPSSNFTFAHDAVGAPRYMSPDGTVTLHGLRFDASTPSGVYPIAVAGPGAVLTIPVVISSQASALGVMQQPSAMRPVSVGSFSVLQVGVAGVGNVPLAEKQLELRFIRQEEDVPREARCAGAGCGVLAPSTVTSQQSNVYGSVLFSFNFDEAATGNYTAVVTVVERPTQQAVRQFTRIKLAKITGVYGVPRNALQATVAQLDVTRRDTVGVVNQLADSDGGAESPVTTTRAERTTPSMMNTLNAGRDALAGKPRPTSITLTTAPFTVRNRVASLEILRFPGIGIDVERDAAVATVVDADDAITTDAGTAPVVRITDSFGRPVVKRPVTLLVVPSSGLAVTAPPVRPVTDDNGVITFVGYKFSPSKTGTYRLHFSASGSDGNTTDQAIRVRIVEASMQSTMKRFAAIICVCVSPMFLASVPHSRFVYIIVAAACSLLLGVGTVVAMSTLWPRLATNFFVKAYFGAAMGGTMLVAVGFVAMAVVTTLRRCSVQTRWRCLDGEGKAEAVWAYCRWIVAVRPEKQAPPPPSLGSKIAARISGVKDTVDSKVDGLHEKLLVELQVAGDATGDGTLEEKGYVRVAARPALQYADAPPTNFLPFNLLVVIGISAILLVVLNFFMVYVYFYVEDQLQVLLNYLPRPDQQQRVEALNAQLVTSLQVATAFAAEEEQQQQQQSGSGGTMPSDYMSSLATTLANVDVVAILDTIRDAVAEFLKNWQVAVAVGTSLANVVVLATMAFAVVSTPQLIRELRQGMHKGVAAFSAPRIARIETYIGLHAMHFMFMFLAVAWPVIVVILPLSVARFRAYLWDKLAVLIIASIVSVAMSIALRIFVGRFFVDAWHFKRLELLAIYNFVDLVLGVFTGIVGTLSRWLQAIVFVTVCFAKLDKSIFPGWFVAFDVAHVGFGAMVSLEARVNNPLYLVAASHMVLRRMMCEVVARAAEQLATRDGDEEAEVLQLSVHTPRSAAGDGNAAVGKLLPGFEQALTGKRANASLQAESDAIAAVLASGARVDVRVEEVGEGAALSAAVVNLLRIELRDLAARQNPLPTDVQSDSRDAAAAVVDAAAFVRQQRAALQRVASRWWLLWLLHANPSIRALRKHRLFTRAPPPDGVLAEASA